MINVEQRSSGYFLTDGSGFVEGPFDTFLQACKEKQIWEVIHRIQKDFEEGDVEALFELLKHLPKKAIRGYLGEDFSDKQINAIVKQHGLSLNKAAKRERLKGHSAAKIEALLGLNYFPYNGKWINRDGIYTDYETSLINFLYENFVK